MIRRRDFLAGLGAAPAVAQSRGGTRPNFVILFTDDQRFDTIRALGNREIHTPNMDRLVRNGVAFTQAAAMGGTQPAVCVASRAMLMTGQSLFRATRNLSGPDAGGSPSPSFHLMPETLRQNGYKTFATGKWHNGAPTFRRCFSEGESIFFGGMGDHMALALQDFDPSGGYPKERGKKATRFSSEIFTDAALGFLNRRKAGDDPFLLYCAYTSPHDPRTAPERFRKLYDPAKLTLPPNFLPEHPFDNGELKIRDELLAPMPRTPAIVRQHLADYYAMVSEVDSQIGRVLDAVERSPEAANTYVILAGDNGLAVGQHGLLGKQNLYEHSIRVPLVISGPNIPRNRTSEAFAYLYDLFPTICEWANVPIPESVDGISLSPAVANPAHRLRESGFFAYRDFQRAIRMREWKLIWYRVGGTEKVQLFRISKDPWERENLADKPEFAGKVREMKARLMGWQKRTGDPLTPV